MSNTTAVVSGDVKGDITSCKIENQEIKVERDSAMSWYQNTTYMSYDVCNKKTIETYQVQDFTGFGVFSVFIIAIVALMVIFGALAHWVENY